MFQRLSGLFRCFFLVAAATSMTLLTAAPARAAQVPFNAGQFAQAQAAGKPVIVYFHATWCPTCKQQVPIVDNLMARPDFQPVTLFVADYDHEVALKKAMHITMQSTFVVFKNGHEVTRSTGQTQPAALEATFRQAL
jgi:thioredoxin 1